MKCNTNTNVPYLEVVMRILIIAASAGAGHVRAAQALEASLRIMKPEADVRRVDILDFTAKMYRKTYAGGYLKMVDRAPALWGALYQASDHVKQHRVQDRFVRFFDKLEFAGFRSFVREFSPDSILATHFLPCQVLAPYRDQGRDLFPPDVDSDRFRRTRLLGSAHRGSVLRWVRGGQGDSHGSRDRGKQDHRLRHPCHAFFLPGSMTARARNSALG